MRLTLSRILVVVLAATLACSPSRQTTLGALTAVNAAVYPGAAWDTIADPRTVGWTGAGLDSVRAALSSSLRLVSWPWSAGTSSSSTATWTP